MASGMARKPKPSIPRREVVVDRDSWIGRARVLALKNMLGLGLTPEEEAFLGPMPRVGVFTREEVVALLGDGERGIPRMLPVDVALGRLGMPIIRVGPDGVPERLEREFPKAWDARVASDRAIATHVARTYGEVPVGWYPDRERLLMSAEEAAGDDVSALGPGGTAAVAELASYFRFDLVPRELRIAGYQMWHRRRLAGIGPRACEGLVFGWWDDVMSGYDVRALCWRGGRASYLAALVAVARDYCLAAAGAELSGAGAWSICDGRYGKIHGSLVSSVLLDDPLGPADPDMRSFGGGIAELYRVLRAGPGAVWSTLPVRERPEQMLEFSDFGFYYLEDAEVIAPGIALPEGAVPGGRVPEPEFDWVSQFASA